MNLLRKFRSLFRRGRLDSEMTEEMRLHLELQAERNRQAGMDPEEAGYAARRQFGNLANIQEQAREARGWRWMEDLLRDGRYAGRALGRNPGFTVTAVAVLALGIGANSAVFNLVQTLLFTPPAYFQPDKVLRVLAQDRRNPANLRDLSYPVYREIRDRTAVFSGLLASVSTGVGLGATDRALAALVSSNYFSVLGVEPARGRAFRDDEETPGRGIPVAIVSHNFWKKQGLDPALLGSTLQVNGRPFTVVGIMPEGFTGTLHLFATEIWLPLGAYEQVMRSSRPAAANALADPADASFLVLGRLRPGMSAATAAPALQGAATRLEQAFPVEQKDQTFRVEPPSRFATSSNDRAVVWIGVVLLGMAASVLLIACLNLTNLLLARGAARRKEIAIRLAIGGGRGRIIRQLLTEGFMLALLSGVGGLIIAWWSSDLLVASLARLAPAELAWSVRPQPALLAATFGLCVAVTAGFALWPAFKLTRGDALGQLKEQAGEDARRRRGKLVPRHPLVALQLALCLALLTVAALFMRGAAKAASAETGLRAQADYLVELDAGLGGFDRTQAGELYRVLHGRLAALPGVEGVSIAGDVPLGNLDFEKSVRPVGSPPATTAGAKEPTARTYGVKWNSVGADYFKTVGLPLLRGRAFTGPESEQPMGPRVAVINDVLARQLWPEGDALGQHLQIVPGNIPPTPAGRENGDIQPGDTVEIIGIVPPTRHTLFEREPDGELYLPFARAYLSHVFFHVKFASLASGTDLGSADLLRKTIRSVDATLPVLSVKSFGQHLDTNFQIWIFRAGAALFSAFGGLALLLSVVGTYGVLAYSVARRSREIGIRIALGALPRTVLRMVLGEGLVILGSGLFIGFLLAAAAGKIVSHLLYQVSALDPVAFAASSLALIAATFLAGWIPARRAARVDPVVALRAE